MQEVFEKIKEKIRKEIEDVIVKDTYTKGKNAGLRKAEIFIDEVAEEYNNGWIPVSERLPDESFGCLVTVMDCDPLTQTDFENILPYFVGYDGETWNDEDGEEIPFEVIAWMPLAEPYHPKGE